MFWSPEKCFGRWMGLYQCLLIQTMMLEIFLSPSSFSVGKMPHLKMVSISNQCLCKPSSYWRDTLLASHHILFQFSMFKLDCKLHTVSPMTCLCDDIQQMSRAHEAVLDLCTDLFAQGQLYTTLSRVRCQQDIQMLFRRERKERTMANIVYKLLDLLHHR